jgi:hypothetical protein
MRYLCLIYYDEQKLQALFKNALDAVVDEALATTRSSARAAAISSRTPSTPFAMGGQSGIRNGEVITTDGPFAGTKEQLGGVMLIEAGDLDDAIRVAAKIPPARLGCVEVRPIQELAPQ